MKNIAIGKYIPGNTFVHRLDPRVKFFLMTALIYVAVVPSHFYALGISAVIVFSVFLLSGLGLGKVRGILKPFKIMLIFLLIINVLTFKEGTQITHIASLDISFLNIWDKAIYRTLIIVVRIVLMIMISSSLTATTKPIDLTIALEDVLRPYILGGVIFASYMVSVNFPMPDIEYYQYYVIGGGVVAGIVLAKIFPVHSIAMIISIALRFIPTLLEETDKIMKAQASRGADFENGKFREKITSMITLIVPLFASSFQKAMDLADAMESRGYVVGQKRTRFRKHVISFKDFVALIFVSGAVAAVVWGLTLGEAIL